MTFFTSLLLAAAVSVAGFCEKAERREPLTVAFFGGSLTWGANATDPNVTSWRGEKSPTGRYTFTTWRHWTKDDEPLDSGLLGPVRLKVQERK